MKLIKPFGKEFNLTAGVIYGDDNHWTQHLNNMWMCIKIRNC